MKIFTFAFMILGVFCYAMEFQKHSWFEMSVFFLLFSFQGIISNPVSEGERFGGKG